MTNNELNGIREIAVFAIVVYLRAWITTSLTAEASHNDYHLMGQLLRYHEPNTSYVMSKNLGLHLWYFSEDLTCFGCL